MLNLQFYAIGTGTLNRNVADPVSLTVPELATLSPLPTNNKVAAVSTPVRDKSGFSSI